MNRPVRTTVVFALISGVVVVPSALVMATYLPWSTAFKICLWADLALYGVLMARWGGARLYLLLFPLAILLGTALWPGTYHGFFLLALGVLSWMRSGICFQGAPARVILAEVTTIVASAALLLVFGAYTSWGWALNICLFYLVHSLYFFIVPLRLTIFDDPICQDPFEKAVEQATKILDGI
jgi:hypothetical protein